MPTLRKDIFKELVALERKLGSVRPGQKTPEPRRLIELRKQRGHLNTTFGLARRGVRDLKAALKSEPENPELLALLADAERVFARDIELAGGRDNNEEVLKKLRRDSIDRFDQALQFARKRLSGPQRAWVHAHRGAAHTFAFFLTNNKQEQAASFAAARSDFAKARRLNPTYTWALQFEAFLYALRGDDGDFHRARTVLKKIKDADSLTQSAVKRSMAMLHFYDQNEAAAKAAVKEGLEAVSMDSEDFTAAYFAAAALRWLHDYYDSGRGRRTTRSDLKEISDHALESARIRAMNAISQASAVIAGIAILQGNNKPATEFLARIQSSPANDLEVRPDLETLSMLRRDPTWRKVIKQPEAERLPTRLKDRRFRTEPQLAY